jgi:hypothetical protein
LIFSLGTFWINPAKLAKVAGNEKRNVGVAKIFLANPENDHLYLKLSCWNIILIRPQVEIFLPAG